MALAIREAVLDDIPWLLEQIQSFADYYGSEKLKLDDPVFAKYFLEELMNEHVFLIAEDNTSGPVGLIAGLASPHALNPSVEVLAAVFWWVAPEHRGGQAGALLLDAFLDWGKRHVQMIDFGVHVKAGIRPTCLEKRGLVLHEQHYMMEV